MSAAERASARVRQLVERAGDARKRVAVDAGLLWELLDENERLRGSVNERKDMLVRALGLPQETRWVGAVQEAARLRREVAS